MFKEIMTDIVQGDRQLVSVLRGWSSGEKELLIAKLEKKATTMDKLKIKPEELSFFDKCAISAMNGLIASANEYLHPDGFEHKLAVDSLKYAGAMVLRRREFLWGEK